MLIIQVTLTVSKIFNDIFVLSYFIHMIMNEKIIYYIYILYYLMKTYLLSNSTY